MPELPRTAEIVIIGAGIMGCSIAWHLAERGVSNIVVLERDLIGRGATADAAGGIRLQFSTETNILLSKYSMDYWENFEERFGVDINFRQQGYLFLLTSDENVAAFRKNVELQQRLDVPVRWVNPEEIAELNPYINMDGIIGGTFCPRDGWADTSTSTMGFASAARRLGVKILEETPVTGITTSNGKVTGVTTPGGEISTSLVVCCAGPQSAPLGDMAGVEIPIQSVRRMSFITEPFDRLPQSLPFTIEFDRSLYFHPESNGFLFGMSNPDEPPSTNKTVDDDWMFTTVEALVNRAPIFEEANVLRGWAGFYEITPDDNPILGYMPDLENMIVAAGFSGHGFMQGPAIGKAISELVLDGAPQIIDLSAFRPSRFREGVLAQEHNVI